jgi:GTP-binding protein HflX
MHKLEKELDVVERTRDIQRQSRKRGRHREVTLVGYTNAGKSTTLNQLTHADVPAEDRLFVTLDPRTRQYQMQGGETILFTDTVGFLSKLPHELVRAFKSTLDSVRLADLLIHVVDGSAENAEEQIEAVRIVLNDIGAGEVPELMVFNKADVEPSWTAELVARHEGSLAVSALTGMGMDRLVETVGDRLRSGDRIISLRLPVERGDLIAAAHREGDVVAQENEDDFVILHVVLDDVGSARFAEWRIPA